MRSYRIISPTSLLHQLMFERANASTEAGQPGTDGHVEIEI